MVDANKLAQNARFEPVLLFLAVNKGVKVQQNQRRKFVSYLPDSGADIATIASMAGHESVSTTAR